MQFKKPKKVTNKTASEKRCNRDKNKITRIFVANFIHIEQKMDTINLASVIVLIGFLVNASYGKFCNFISI